jgi:hypothetical protein
MFFFPYLIEDSTFASGLLGCLSGETEKGREGEIITSKIQVFS